jgi:hypothetical protein
MAELNTNSRPMKWHIYGPDHYPLCWDDTALEFDTKEDAKEFLASAISNSEHTEEFYQEAIIEEDILYYDGGYIDATNLRVKWNEDEWEAILAEK